MKPAPAPKTLPEAEKREKHSIWFLPSVFKALQHEAIDRNMSIGAVLEEAMSLRGAWALVDRKKTP